MVDPVFFDVDSDLGAQYIAAMQLGGTYAYAGRDWVCSRVAKLLGATIEEEVHNHHNFAWLEEHDGKQLWVCRKGATPAFPGQRGFVGGTMGEQSVILEGVAPDLSTAEGSEAAAEQAASLCSTVHGAGRVMGRKQAAGVFDRKTGVVQARRPGQAGDDERLAAAVQRRPARRRSRRVAALLQAPPRGARSARPHHPHPAHAHARSA